MIGLYEVLEGCVKCVVMQDSWWCMRCDRIESGVWNVVGMLEVVIVSDMYPSLACRIPTHVALLRSEPLPAHAVSITTGTTSCTSKS